MKELVIMLKVLDPNLESRSRLRSELVIVFEANAGAGALFRSIPGPAVLSVTLDDGFGTNGTLPVAASSM